MKAVSLAGSAGAARTIAITRAVSPNINRCELTHLVRMPINVSLARRQHSKYKRALAALGCEILPLPAEPELPDSVFVEDTALVFDECAILTRPGAETRRAEVPSVRAVLASYRTLREIEAPATLDGGDVLRIERRVFVGITTRTNDAAVEQLDRLLAPLGYEVVAVPVHGCLHLKSAVSVVADNLIVADTNAVDASMFDVPCMEVPDYAANMLRIGETVLCPMTAEYDALRLRNRGVRVQLLDTSELAKAEAGLTCCSIVFPAKPRRRVH